MAQGYFGSVCVEDIFTGQIVKGSNGKNYICVDDLKGGAFNKSQKNGKTYIGIGVYVNDEVDNYQNIAGISLQQSQAEREAQQKKQYIGNLKYAQAKGTAAAPGVSSVLGSGSHPGGPAPAIEDTSELPF